MTQDEQRIINLKIEVERQRKMIMELNLIIKSYETKIDEVYNLVKSKESIK